MPILFNALALAGVCATAAMHWWGLMYDLYWIYWWWDIPAHIVGGLTIGFWAAAVSWRLGLNSRHALYFMLGLALSVGVAWEVWEAIVGVGGGPEGYALDTLKDFADDLIGVFLAWLLYGHLINRTP